MFGQAIEARFAAIAILFAGLPILGCNGPDPSGPGTPTPPPAASLIVTIEPNSVTLAAGESRQLRGGVRTPQGIFLQAALSWSSADSSVASVSGTGMVTAKREGQTAILANA